MSQEEQIKKYILMVESLESLKDSLKKRFPRKNETGVQGLRNAGMDFELDVSKLFPFIYHTKPIPNLPSQYGRIQNPIAYILKF